MLGRDYDERVWPSIGTKVLKAIVAPFDADQLLMERPSVSATVRDAFLARARDFNLLLEDVAITHLSYGAEFSHAVEQKHVNRGTQLVTGGVVRTPVFTMSYSMFYDVVQYDPKLLDGSGEVSNFKWNGW